MFTILPTPSAATGNYYPSGYNPSGYITSGQTGQFYPYNNPSNFANSGNLQSTGQTLYSVITALSGQANTNYATIINLTQTGVTIENQINLLSGYFTGRYISGLVQGNNITISNNNNGTYTINSTAAGGGSTLFTGVTGISITGSTSISGLFNITGDTTTSYTVSGQTLTIKVNQNTIATTANLQSTGQNLYSIITGLSGQANTNYITNLETGQFYPAQNPSGFSKVLVTGSSSIYNANISGSGNVSVVYTNGLIVISGGGTSSAGGNYYPSGSNPSGYITSGQYYAPTASGYYTGALISIAWNSGNIFRYILTGNATFSFTEYVDGQTISCLIGNTGTNSYTATWPSTVHWPSNIIPIQSTGSQCDIYSFLYCFTGFYGNCVQQFSN